MLKRKKPLAKNRKPIARKKPLARGKPPRRKKVLPKVLSAFERRAQRLVRKALSRRRGTPKRFAHRRNPEYKSWIKTLPCVLLGRNALETNGAFSGSYNHVCLGNIDPMHVKSRGAGADDLGAMVPCCHAEHEASRRRGIRTWATVWFGGLAELRRIAAETYPQQYEKAKALGWTPGGEFPA